MVHYYDMENDQISFGWEWPDVIELSGAAPTATELDGFGGLTVNQYAGQMLRVLDGLQKDVTYWVISNTADTLTLQGNGDYRPNGAAGEGGPPIEEDARVAISTNGLIPDDRAEYIGDFGGGTPPEPEPDIRTHYGHGGGGIRLASSVGNIRFPGGSIPVSVQKPYLLFGLGDVKAIGTSVTASNTLASAISAWDNQVTLSDATGFTVGDEVQISADSGEDDPELRKITAIDVDTLTLNYPLLRPHSSGDAVEEVTSPYTYTIRHSRIPLRSFSLVHAYMDPYGSEDDLITTYQGLYIQKASLKSATDEHLKAELSLWGMDSQIDPDDLPRPSVTRDTDNYYWWDDAEVQYNGATVAIPQDVTCDWDNKLRWVKTLGGNKGKKPYRIGLGVPEWKTALKYLPVSKALLNDREAETERDAYVKFTRETNDTLKFDMTAARPTVKWSWKDEGDVEGDVNLNIEETELIIESTTAMY